MTEAKRTLVPGMWGRCGRAIPDPQASELDNAQPLRAREDYRQGRDCLTPVGKYSIYAGKPTASEIQRHNDRAQGLRRMLATAVGAWVAFGLLLWLYHSTVQG